MGSDSSGRQVRALGLFSGSLDSALAIKTLQAQGVSVACVHFETGFVWEASREAVAAAVSRQDPPVEVIDVAQAYLREVVLAPRHGYGSGINPCIDCRVFMLREADRLARARGIDLLFSGEVVGQRSFGQRRSALLQIEHEADVAGRLLRPLCARLMPPTHAELAGHVDRSRLRRIHGRSRREQLARAAELGLEGYPAPASGCCWLANRAFARRLRDRLAHVAPGADVLLDSDGRELLKTGRHFRLAWDLKAVVGRDATESAWLEAHAGDRWTGQVSSRRGAVVLLEGRFDPSRHGNVAGLAARYSRHRGERLVRVTLRRGAEIHRLQAAPADEARLDAWRI